MHRIRMHDTYIHTNQNDIYTKRDKDPMRGRLLALGLLLKVEILERQVFIHCTMGRTAGPKV